MGFVVRNAAGEVLASGTKRQRGGGSSTLMEAMALLFSLNIARSSRLRNLEVESDFEQLIRAPNDKLVDEPYVMQIIEDIRFIGHQINCSMFSFIRRSANGVAHILAHLGQNVDYEQIWLEELPPACNVSFLNDVSHLPTIST